MTPASRAKPGNPTEPRSRATGNVPANGGSAGSPPSTRPGSTQAVYVISVAAELVGMHPQTLRIYERKGLLDPIRTSGGSRRFSEHDLQRLLRIQELTAEGLNLEGVRRVLELELEVDALREELDEVRAEAREAVERTHRKYRRDLVPVSQAPVLYRKLNRKLHR